MRQFGRIVREMADTPKTEFDKLIAEAFSTRQRMNGKGAGADEAPASQGGDDKQPSPTRTRKGRPVLRLVMDNSRCLGTASRRNERSPRSVVPRHLVLVKG